MTKDEFRLQVALTLIPGVVKLLETLQPGDISNILSQAPPKNFLESYNQYHQALAFTLDTQARLIVGQLYR